MFAAFPRQAFTLLESRPIVEFLDHNNIRFTPFPVELVTCAFNTFRLLTCDDLLKDAQLAHLVAREVDLIPLSVNRLLPSWDKILPKPRSVRRDRLTQL